MPYTDKDLEGLSAEQKVYFIAKTAYEDLEKRQKEIDNILKTGKLSPSLKPEGGPRAASRNLSAQQANALRLERDEVKMNYLNDINKHMKDVPEEMRILVKHNAMEIMRGEIKYEAQKTPEKDNSLSSQFLPSAVMQAQPKSESKASDQSSFLQQQKEGDKTAKQEEPVSEFLPSALLKSRRKEKEQTGSTLEQSRFFKGKGKD